MTHRVQDDARLVALSAKDARDRDPVEIGKVMVDDEHVRVKPCRQTERARPVCCHSNEVKFDLGIDQVPQLFAYRRVIVGNEDADWTRRRSITRRLFWVSHDRDALPSGRRKECRQSTDY
jgi:hypothetical protein